MTLQQARAYTDIKGGLSTCPFFWGVFLNIYIYICQYIYIYIYIYINEYMYICMRVCFCLRTAFPVKQIKTSKYQVGSGNETLNS